MAFQFCKAGTSTRLGGLLLAAALVCPEVVSASSFRYPHRYALVIGNKAYSHAPLDNARDDALRVQQALEKIGFHVNLHQDLSKDKLEEAIDRFGSLLKKKKAIGFFYYAGHAVQLKDKNWLIAAGDFEVEQALDHAVELDRLMKVLRSSDNLLNIIVLDACRNNPYKGKSRTFARDKTRGLAVVRAPQGKLGTLIAYATEPGDVASDNGHYAKALAENLPRSGQRLIDVFRNTGQYVQQKTKKDQVPWLNESIQGQVWLADPDWAPTSVVLSDIVEEPPTQGVRVVGWSTLSASLAGTAVGGAFLAMMNNHLGNADDILNQGDPNNLTTEQRQTFFRERKSAQDDALIGRSLLIASGAALLTSGVLFLIDHLLFKDQRAIAWVPAFSGRSFALSY